MGAMGPDGARWRPMRADAGRRVRAGAGDRALIGAGGRAPAAAAGDPAARRAHLRWESCTPAGGAGARVRAQRRARA